MYKNNIFERFEEGEIFKEKLIHKTRSVEPSEFKEYDIYTLTDLGEKYFSQIYGIKISSLDELLDSEIQKSVFYIVFKFDSDALPFVKRIVSCGGKFVPYLKFSKTQYRFIDKLCYNAIFNTYSMKERIAHFNVPIYQNICKALDFSKNLQGNYIEIGVFSGGSALVALNYYKEQIDFNLFPKKQFYFFDTFSGFDYEDAFSSSDTIWLQTHKFQSSKNKWIDEVEKTLNSSNQKFNLIELDISSEDLPDIGKLSVANIDVDMYEPTLKALKKVSPQIVNGGIIILEDVPSTPGLYGAALALDEFINSGFGDQYKKINMDSQIFLIKKFS